MEKIHQLKPEVSDKILNITMYKGTLTEKLNIKEKGKLSFRPLLFLTHHRFESDSLTSQAGIFISGLF